MAFKQGQSGNPDGRPKGAKGKATLLKEERRAIFDSEVSKRWLEVIGQLPPQYLADQFLGKAPDKTELSGNLKTTQDLTSEQIIAITQWAKDKLKNERM